MRAFITRDLSESSEFERLLKTNGWEVEGRSLLQITPVAFGPPPQTDWIFFSSQNGVRYFFEAMGSDGPTARLAAIGPSTAEALKPFGRAADFIGDGDPDNTARMLLPIVEHQSILLPCARNARQKIRQLLDEQATCIPWVVYENVPVPTPEASGADVLVFTSPMNAEAYCAKHPVLPQQRIAAIGRSTAETLQKLGLGPVLVPEEPSERGLAALLLSLPK